MPSSVHPCFTFMERSNFRLMSKRDRAKCHLDHVQGENCMGSLSPSKISASGDRVRLRLDMPSHQIGQMPI
jgi:hypothetical protein